MDDEKGMLRMIQFVRGQATLRPDDGPGSDAENEIVGPYLTAALVAECGFIEIEQDVEDIAHTLGRPFRELRAGYFVGTDGHLVGNN